MSPRHNDTIWSGIVSEHATDGLRKQKFGVNLVDAG